MLVARRNKPRNKFEQSGQDFLKKVHANFEYEAVKVTYNLSREYIPDFTIFDKKTGKINFHIEFKGFFRAVDQVKMKAVKKTNPDLDVRFVFQNVSKKIRKGAKLTYGEWATKWGFTWAEGSIPKSWLK